MKKGLIHGKKWKSSNTDDPPSAPVLRIVRRGRSTSRGVRAKRGVLSVDVPLP